MEILPVEHSRSLERALALILQEKIIAFPTDTVYGLGASAFSTVGINRIFLAKQRSYNKAVAVLLGDLEQLDQITGRMSPLATKLALKFWPGALTLVVHKHPSLPKILSPQDTIGVRMPDHEFARSLLRLCGPLATSSANLSGSAANPLSAIDVLGDLYGSIDLLLDGGFTPGGIPSTVVDCTSAHPLVLRKGSIPEEAILASID